MKKILVIGELCIDKFIYGDVKRLSPEAPVPVFNEVETVENKGMAGNVVENIKSIYQDCEIIHWHQQNMITKTRYVDLKSNHMFIRVDDEKSSASFWGIAIFDVMYYLHVYLRVSMEHSVESNHNTS